MTEVKWIKICTDIFDDEKIILIEAMPDAYAIITAWFKLLCLAGKQNNSGVFMINDHIPYTDEMFATIFRMPLNTVRLALNTFEKFGMIEIVNGAVTIPKWGIHQNLEGIERSNELTKQRMRKYRERQKLKSLPDADGVTLRNSNVTVTHTEEDIDIEEEKRKKENNIKEKKKMPPTLEEVTAYCNERRNGINPQSFIDFYEARGWMIGKNKMKDWKAAVRTWENRDNDSRRNTRNTETKSRFDDLVTVE